MDDFQVHNIALKTLKQRCEYLQQRLNAVEEENCRLKLEKVQDLNTRPKEPNSLEEQIIILNQEKLRMTDKINMIANENIALWSQLSKVYPGNSISSLKYSVSAVSDNQMQKLPQSDTSNDYSRESLEEISLKLINGIIMGKNELERQYSQMIDLQKENSEDENSPFVPKQFDNRVAMKSLKDYLQKLKDFKQALYNQKKELSSAIMLLKDSQKFSREQIDFRNISNCDNLSYRAESDNQNQTPSDFSTLQVLERLPNLNCSDRMICPMCGESYSGSFKDFHNHVSYHFEDENYEFVDAR